MDGRNTVISLMTDKELCHFICQTDNNTAIYTEKVISLTTRSPRNIGDQSYLYRLLVTMNSPFRPVKTVKSGSLLPHSRRPSKGRISFAYAQAGAQHASSAADTQPHRLTRAGRGDGQDRGCQLLMVVQIWIVA